MSRNVERKELPPETRFLLAENDLDVHQNEITALEERLGKILWAIVGLLISTSTAAVLLALNLVVER